MRLWIVSMLIKFEPLVSLLLHARKPSAISAIAPMPEDFPNGQRGLSRLPPVSPLMLLWRKQSFRSNRPARHSSSPLTLRCWTTCPYGQSGTGRLTLSAALRPPNLRPYQTRSARLYSSGVETSVFLLFSPKARRLDPFIPHSPGGVITDSAPKVRYEHCPSNPKVRHNRSLVV